ncbi:MAG: peptidylprolyl isomerase [Paracoccaceae bacterium]
MTSFAKIRRWAAAGALLVAGAVAAQAQDLFAPVTIVNDRAITRYELNQRVLFLQLLRQPGDLPKIALDGLVDERLQLEAATALGLELTPEAVEAGLTEFAARANLTPEQFIQAIGQGGVEPQTFRDFVEAGLSWRELIRGKYGATTTISDNEVDRAIAAGFAGGGEVRVLLSEIRLPTNLDVAGGDAMALARRLSATIKTEAGFIDAARRYSQSETSTRGGRLEWQPISALPGNIATKLRAMKTDTISEPFSVPGAVILYFLRDIAQSGGEASTSKTLDYAQFLIPEDSGTAAEIARLRANNDTCDDLYAEGRGLSANRLLRDALPEAQVPRDIAAALAPLDPGEASTALTRGGWRVFLMLCSRNPTSEVPPAREELRTQLQNQRLAAQAELFMTELRAAAIIRTP